MLITASTLPKASGQEGVGEDKPLLSCSEGMCTGELVTVTVMAACFQPESGEWSNQISIRGTGDTAILKQYMHLNRDLRDGQNLCATEKHDSASERSPPPLSLRRSYASLQADRSPLRQRDTAHPATTQPSQ